MSVSDPNTPNVADPESPNPPSPPGNGNGDGNGHPPSLRITSVSPIAGALSGGFDVTITGMGFQAGAEVFFGAVASTEVHVLAVNQVTARVPQATETGTVRVSLVNPDGATAELTSGFTYVTSVEGNHAEVLGVEPLNVIEDTDTQITIRGRNLIAAHENGLVALRGSTRANISVSDFVSSRDEATNIESLTCTVRVIATPALAPEERMAIQVLAALRHGAQTDGVVESSREMFIVLPKTVPVTLAYTGSVDPSKPNLVIVTGRNLEGCSLDVGANAVVHSQRSDDEYVAALVSYPTDHPAPQFAVRANGGGEVARFEMSVATADAPAAAAAKGEGQAPIIIGGNGGNGGEPPDGGGGPGLTPVPGQQVVGPTADSSVVVNLNGQSLTSFNFDWSSFVAQFFRIRFRLRIANFTRVVPFFDGGGEEVGSPVVAKVGQLMNLRGMGILVALRVEITITISVSVILGYRFDLGFNPYNEFPQFGFGLGSVVIGFRFDFDIDIEVFFMTALILPDGSLRVLAVVDIDINFHFEISTDGRSLRFNNFKHKVNRRKITPFSNLLPCDGRFQLAEDNGQTVFPDGFGGNQTFYFVRGPGRCCLSWNFDLDLIRFTDDGPETIIQPPFDVDYCLNALDSFNQNVPIVVSDQCPDGFPQVEELTVADPDKGEDNVRALMQPVDARDGSFLPHGELQDVTDLGYQAFFYLMDPDKPVLDSHALFGGQAIATQPGSNTICVELGNVDVTVIDTGVEAPTFWPGAVTGFSILSFLARGLAPALLFKCDSGIGLPVVVDPLAANRITVTPMIVYRDPANSSNLIPAQKVLLRNEPFQAQREYLLAVRVTMGSTTPAQHLKFKVKTAKLDRAPLAQIPNAPFGRGRTRDEANLFFQGKLANEQEETTLSVTPSDSGHTLEVPQFTITPNNFEQGPDTGDVTAMVMPGHDVANRDVKLTIELEVTSDNSSTTISVNDKKFDLTVRNAENFEEYLRVFQEPQKLLQSSGLKDFASEFATQLFGLAAGADLNDFLKKQGESLWTKALAEIKNKKDDRPLYWTRLRCLAALRAYYASKTPPGQPSTATIHQFEYPSRGLSTTGKLELEANTKAIFTGFDPFSLPTRAGTSNPSGLAALDLNGRNLGASGAEVHIQSVIFPVRYEDFKEKMIETALSSNISSVKMVMTCSDNSGREFYDVERWAGRRRTTTVPDNSAKLADGVEPPNLPGNEFYESTLPYELVITDATDRLSAPTAARPFVIDQSYQKSGESFAAPETTDTPEKKVFWYTKLVQDNPGGISIEGSGGNYLSNEIFYRVALARGTSTVATGHFHVPSTGSDPSSTGQPLVTGVTEAVRRMLIAITQSKFTYPTKMEFPKTVVHQTRISTLTVRNESTETINVESAEVAAPFGVTLPGTPPIAVPPQGTLTLNLSFTPTAVNPPTLPFQQAVRVKNTDQRFVMAVTLKGEGVATMPAPSITDFNPKSGELGDSTTITGANFTGVTNVRIGTTSGQGVAFNFVSDTEIEATVNNNAKTGKIEVETPAGKVSSTVNFTVRRKRPPSPEEFGAELAVRRTELGLSNRDAAAQLGTSAGTYRRWERGLDRPSVRFHPAIIAFLGYDPNPNPQEFGQLIRAARERDGLSRSELGRQLGVSSSTVKAWETGTVSRPSPRVAEIFEGYVNEE
jgi:transcriptional regulator with XRE-family HTH domain/pyrrolidone-carboxylate peptidase